MAEEVWVDNLIDKAIIEALGKAEKEMLPRKAIIKIVKGRIGGNDSVIAKRIEKMSKEPYSYLIKIGKKKSGIYQKNPGIQFTFVGEKLPPEAPTIKPTEVSLKAREEHTEDLKKAIRNWIENFPKVPYAEDSRAFLEAVDKCEHYPLFKDLPNHLPQSRYNVCQQWGEFKNGVKEEDKRKEELLKLIEKRISDIFKGLRLKFVRRYNNLSDYECSLPFLIYETLIHYEIGTIEVERRYRATFNEEEDEEFMHELGRFHAEFYMTRDRFSEMIVFEKENSAIWGDPKESIDRGWYIEPWECIRVPKKDIGILQKGKGEVIAFITGPTPEIKKSIDDIITKIDQLEKDKEYLVNDLRDLLFFKTFPGACKYLGVE